MEVVGEVVLSALLEPLIGKMTSGEFLKFARKKQVEKELNKWSLRLQEIDAVLKSAEEKPITNPIVTSWLAKLRDLAYDVEDILDEFQTEAFATKLKEESGASGSTVQKLLPACCVGRKPIAIKRNMQRGSKLEDITERLEELVKQKIVLDLGINSGRRPNITRTRVTTSLVEESDVCGREKDKEAVLNFLMSGDARCSVIPIVGMGGIGKTTLAQLAYSHESLKFDCKAWVCVSDDFDNRRITKTILQHWGSCDHNDLNVLQERLKKELSGKKFLIVLDDVWSNNYEEWKTLLLPFSAGAPGSKVIITTRDEDIAKTMGSVRAHMLGRLSFEESLCIFTQHSLDANNFDEHPDFKETGEKIVQKCKGLPLAAKTLGGLLRHKQNPEEWEDILNSEMWKLPEGKSGILSALRLSYHHLPSHLKQCFSYCAIFPKDYEFDKDELVLLWMAQGFLQQEMGKEEMANLGRAYFRDLLSRSFFQHSSSNNSRYVMHDLISDLARYVGGETCFHLDDKVMAANSVASNATVRYSAFIPQCLDISRRFDVFKKMKGLRTFLALPTGWNHHLSSKVLDDLVPTFKCLRALSLAGYAIKELSDSIGALKLLRYLNLSDTWIKRLPESLGELINLETLRLHGCHDLVELPACIGNLINLQCLDIRDTDCLEKMLLQFSKLKNLRTLPKFIVEDGNGLRIEELERLPHLKGQLLIKGLQNVVHSGDAERARLKDKGGLVDLALEWVDDFNGPRDGGNEQQILNKLKPPPSLEKLSLRAYGGTEFPPWIGDHSFTKMVHLELFDCRNITSLPSLGKLAALRHLRIKGLDGVKEVSMEDFQSLETLRIEDMLGWEQWCLSDCPSERVGAGNFPKLHELSLINCPELNGKLPSCLSSLKKLRVERCQVAVLRVVADLTSLKTLIIDNILGLVSLHEELLQVLVALEDLQIIDCKELMYLWKDGIDLDKLGHLKRLKIWVCEQLVSVVEGEDGLLPRNLQVLKISSCEHLKKLPNGLYSLSSLRELEISRCPRLVSFPEGTGLPCCLKRLEIGDCDSLESLPHGMITTTTNGNKNQRCLLEEIKIDSCTSLKYFPKGRGGRLPTTLKQFSILRCDKLEFPDVVFQVEDAHDDMSRHYPHLEDLSVWNFSLASFPTGFKFPTSLKRLKFWDCKMLKSLASSSLHTLSHLSELGISNCDELELFPEGGLPLPNLIRFYIWGCEKLRCLPNHMENLTSLQHLSIGSCSSLESFPEWGFPPNLKFLRIVDCKKLTGQPMSREWGLHALASLEELTIGGGVDDCFPDEDCLLLPTSLARLRIFNNKNLKSISRGIQHLTSLKTLYIWDCPNLKSLPKEGCPPTLGRLRIRSCPLLAERCSEKKGDYWPIIAQIPRVKIVE